MSPLRSYCRSNPITSFLAIALMLMAEGVCSQLPAVSFQHLRRDIDLLSSLYFAVAEDQYGFIWFGSYDGGGLYRYDGYSLISFLPDANRLQTTLGSGMISEVYCASDNLIYVGTYLGFASLNLVTGRIESFNNQYDQMPEYLMGNVMAFFSDTLHKVLWIGTRYGLAKMDPEDRASFSFLRPQTPVDNFHIPEEVWRILPDPKQPDRLWLATANGLFQFQIQSETYTRIASTARFDTMGILTDLYFDEKGVVWMSTTKGFMTGYNPSTKEWKVHLIPQSESLPSAQKSVHRILPAGKDQAWISTQTGAGKINLETGDVKLWEHDDSRPDGLLPNGGFRDMLNDRHGRLWITSWHGVQYARQSFMERSSTVTNLRAVITGMETVPAYENANKPLLYSGVVALQKEQRDITLHYVLPNPLEPGAELYQYRLHGFDDDWITTDQRTVRYPRLHGGTYTFEIRAKENKDQEWLPSTILEIKIPKRLIEHWWFWALLLSALFLMIWLLYRSLISRAKREERLKADFEHQLSEIQMQALRAQMNPHFLFNSLNSIKYFAISKSKDETAAYLSKFSLLVRAILNNSKSRTISLKDELDALQLYIEIEHLRLDGKFDYQIDIDSGIHIKQAQIPPMILQPYVENAIWHGLMHKDGRGKLLVQVKDMGHQIQCVIEDNGIGRMKASEFRGKQTDHKKSVGMQITSDRIALINRIYHIDTQVHVIDLSDESGAATGTRVVINIPLIHDEEE